MQRLTVRKYTETVKYALGGVFFGFCFPVVATILDLLVQGRGVTFAGALFVQVAQPLHWIIDTAPFFLGIFAAAVGKRQDMLRTLVTDLDRQVAVCRAEFLAQAEKLQAVIVSHETTEAALRSSEERYKAISETSVDYAFSFRLADNGLVYCEWLTPSFSRITGYSVAEVLAMPNPWCLYTHPDDLPVLQRGVESWRSGKPSVREFRILTKHREIRWVRSHTRPVLDEQGAVIRIWGAAHDITEYKQAEAALRDSQERFALAMHGANDGLWDWNSVTNEVFYSPRLKELLGSQEQEFLPTFETFSAQIHPDEVADVLAKLRYCLENGVLYDAEFRMCTKSGESCWFQSRGQAVQNHEGQPLRMVGSLRDITERKRIEATLQENEQLFRSLATSSPIGIVRTDELGEAVYTNPRWQEISGMLPEEALGSGWIEAIHPEDREAVLTEWGACTTDERAYEGEFRFQQSNGVIRWVCSRAVPVHSEQDVVIGYVGTVEDITER
ncbi:MAG: PAS domain-containing protein, partial [Candidatus Binatia bacterium]